MLLVLFQELLVGAVLGLGFVTAVDPTQNQQGLLVGNFLTVLGVTLIFATDMHHLVIAALNDSYTIFQPSEIPLVGDVAQHVTGIVATSFLGACERDGRNRRG
jgi:flagellar biosynthetic protein FliR